MMFASSLGVGIYFLVLTVLAVLALMLTLVLGFLLTLVALLLEHTSITHHVLNYYNFLFYS